MQLKFADTIFFNRKMFLYYRGVNSNVAVNGNVKFVDIFERRSKRVKNYTCSQLKEPTISKSFICSFYDLHESKILKLWPRGHAKVIDAYFQA